MIQYNWNVTQMDRKTDDGFVITVHYNIMAIDGEFTAQTYGTVGYTQEEGEYTPYEELTKEQVVGWVQTSLGKDEVETSLASQIEAQKNPVTESGVPWTTV